MPDQPTGQNLGINDGCICKHPPLERPTMNGICPDYGGSVFTAPPPNHRATDELPGQTLDTNDQSSLLQEH